MADTVAKVDKVAEAGLTLVNGYNMCLDRDGPDNDREKQLLGCRARSLGTTSIVDGWCLNGGKYFVVTTF